MLSDGYILFSAKSKNGRLGLTQSLNHSGYVYYVFKDLSHYCSRYPLFRKRSRYSTLTYSLEIIIRPMPCITKLYNLF